MPWVSVEYDCGRCVLVYKHFSTRYGSKGKITYTKTDTKGKTTTQQKACNDRRIEIQYDALANMNFGEGDYFITYTFKRGMLPVLENGKPDMKRLKRIWKTYRDNLRAFYRKNGHELKYIYSFQYEDCRPHFHFLCNNPDINISKFPKWKYGTPKIEILDDRPHHTIGEYFARGTPVEAETDDGIVIVTHKKGKLGSSRNLIRPEPKIKRLKRPSWNCYPKSRKGYDITDVENGYTFNPYNNGYYNCQFYRLVKRRI